MKNRLHLNLSLNYREGLRMREATTLYVDFCWQYGHFNRRSLPERIERKEPPGIQ